MEISNTCLQQWYENIKKINKCNQKITAYTICVICMVTIIVLIILDVLVPELVLYEIYYFKVKKELILYLVTASLINMYLTTLLLWYGIAKNISWCILYWIIVMIIYWNAHLACSVISIVNYVMEGLEEKVKKNPQRTIGLFLSQAIWLMMIAFMWYYWKKMKEINDVANLVQYVAERGSSILSEHRARRQSAESHQLQQTQQTQES